MVKLTDVMKRLLDPIIWASEELPVHVVWVNIYAEACEEFSFLAMWAHQSDDKRGFLNAGGRAEKANSRRVGRQPHHEK